jgi:hypothetical protein
MTIKNTITALVLGSALVAGGGCRPDNTINSGVPAGEYDIYFRGRSATLKISNDEQANCNRFEECKQTCSLYFNEYSEDNEVQIIDHGCNGRIDDLLESGKKVYSAKELKDAEKLKPFNEIMGIALKQVRKKYEKKGKDEVDRILDKI